MKLPILFVIFLSFLTIVNINKANADLIVNENFKANFYQQVFVDAHLGLVESAFNKSLREYSCIGGNLNYEVLKPYSSRIFSADRPGKLEYNYQIFCQSKDLISFRFGFEPAGYDEDYSQIVTEITTQKGTQKTRWCIYATRTKFVPCYAELPIIKNLSIPKI